MKVVPLHIKGYILVELYFETFIWKGLKMKRITITKYLMDALMKNGSTFQTPDILFS